MVTLSILLGSAVSAQKVLPAILATRRPPLTNHRGVVVLANGDTIRGTMKFDPTYTNTADLYFQDDSGNKKYFHFRQLQSVRLFDADSTLPVHNFTDFIKIRGEKGWWRKILDGKAELYDNALYAGESPGRVGNKVWLYKEGQFTDLTQKGTFGIKEDLVRFINTNYHRKVKGKDFPSEAALLKYISAL